MIKRKSPKEGKIIFSSRLYSFTLITTGVEALVMYYIKCIIYANFIHTLDLLIQPYSTKITYVYWLL